ncbi:hypothetical protein [Paramuribaculum intestinale]|uniref:hypothetical protein n=2 Tax=Paramuribaculum intestinale TaxID=2094151 RepID=UPI0025B07319|nr:hypothetical protein [Paramuribaculum intestinale]
MKKLWISIALLVIASGLAGALLKSGEWIFGLISMAFVAWATRNVFVKTTRERRAVGLLLDALRNDDYSRRITGLSEETALQLYRWYSEKIKEKRSRTGTCPLYNIASYQLGRDPGG